MWTVFIGPKITFYVRKMKDPKNNTGPFSIPFKFYRTLSINVVSFGIQKTMVVSTGTGTRKTVSTISDLTIFLEINFYWLIKYFVWNSAHFYLDLILRKKCGWTKEVGVCAKLRGTLVHAKAIAIAYIFLWFCLFWSVWYVHIPY